MFLKSLKIPKVAFIFVSETRLPLLKCIFVFIHICSDDSACLAALFLFLVPCSTFVHRFTLLTWASSDIGKFEEWNLKFRDESEERSPNLWKSCLNSVYKMLKPWFNICVSLCVFFYLLMLKTFSFLVYLYLNWILFYCNWFLIFQYL